MHWSNKIYKGFGWVLVISLILFFILRSFPWFSSFNAKILLTDFTQAEIDHFANFAFQERELKKWRDDIKIKILKQNDRHDEVIGMIMECINVLNSLVEEIDIKLVPDNSNVSMVFLDTMAGDLLGYAPTLNATFRIPYPTIKSGRIEILVGSRKIEEFNSTVYHEFTHILGFHHNLLVDYQSVFNPGPRKLIENEEGDRMVPSFENYSDLDKAAIRILYDKDVGIDPGLTKRKFFRMIEKAKKEMGYDDPVVGGG